MRSTTDHVHEGHDQTAPRPTDARRPWMPRQRRRPPVKRSHDDRSVPTGSHLHPIITQSGTPEGLGRWGMSGIEDFTVEELAQLHQKPAGWIRSGPRPRAHRRRPRVIPGKMAHPA